MIRDVLTIVLSIAFSALFLGTSYSDVVGHEPPNSTSAFDLIVGRFCIGNIPASSRIVSRTIQQGTDVYEDWDIEWVADSGASPESRVPIIRLFKTDIAQTAGQTCEELSGTLLLGGDIEAISL